jgi:hypothetical protein
MSSPISHRTQPRSNFTVGAVGHRFLPAERSSLLDAITRTFQELAGQWPLDPARMKLLVSVAEGADRLFIEAAAELGVPYICVLPCSPACFEEDFDSPASIERFRELLAGAEAIVQPDAEYANRVGGYLWASHYIIDRADALVAVWDGAPANGPAGTGDSVTNAGARCIPVIWIPTDAPHEPVELIAAAARPD